MRIPLLGMACLQLLNGGGKLPVICSNVPPCFSPWVLSSENEVSGAPRGGVACSECEREVGGAGQREKHGLFCTGRGKAWFMTGRKGHGGNVAVC